MKLEQAEYIIFHELKQVMVLLMTGSDIYHS